MPIFTDEPEVKQPQTVTPPAFSGEDYLRKTLDRQAGDVLKIHKVGVHSYRVNWYAPVACTMAGLNPMSIRQSRFITVQEHAGQVEMDVHCN